LSDGEVHDLVNCGGVGCKSRRNSGSGGG
jgi:hypothetical protein